MPKQTVRKTLNSQQADQLDSMLLKKFTELSEDKVCLLDDIVNDYLYALENCIDIDIEAASEMFSHGLSNTVH